MENKMKENGIEYVLVGDYCIPNLTLPDKEPSIGKYRRMHRDYLKERHPMSFNHLLLERQLRTHLADLNEQAQSRSQLIIRQIQAAESVTEELKAYDQMAWVQAMNSIRERVTEIVYSNVVFV